MLPEEDRFWSKVDVPPFGPLDGCWLWMGGRDRDGYGRFDRSRPAHPRSYAAHRYAWELENGPVPEGLELDHVCGVRHCVRVSHLDAVSHAMNIRQQVGRKVS